MTRVLVVDDNSLDLAIMVKVLQKGGFEVFEADSAWNALQLMSRQPVDVVVSDHQMPEENGISLLQKVRARYPGVCRVLTSREPPGGILDTAIKSQLVEHFTMKVITAEQLRMFIHASAEMNAGAAVVATAGGALS